MENGLYSTFVNQIVSLSPLQESLLNASIDEIQRILCNKYGAKLSSRYQNEIQECQEIVQICLDLNIDLNHPKSKYSTLLHFVAKKLDDKTFKMILNRNTDLNINALLYARNYIGKTLLHFVVEEEKENLIKYLHESGADFNVKDVFLKTPVFYAISQKNPRLVRLLLNYGAKIHCQNFLLENSTLAIWTLDKEIIKMLLEGGCDLSAENNGFLPIDSIFFQFANVYPFNDQTCFNVWETVKFLCLYGANMNLRNDTGSAILHTLCKKGLLDDVLFAIRYGADLLSTYDGSTTLHRAIYGNNFDLVHFLLRNGLNINAKESINGETPLHKLSKFSWDHNFVPGSGLKFPDKRTKEFVNMIEYLVDNGADVNSLDNNLKGPLDKSISLNLLEIVECLLGLKANVHLFQNIFISINNVSFVKSTGNNFTRTDSAELLFAFLAMTEDDISKFIGGPYSGDTGWIKPFFWQCKIQVIEMKNRNISQQSNLSFFDFLSKELMEVAVVCRSEDLMLRLESGEFQAYRYLLEKRIERVQLLKNVLVHFLEKLVKKSLPIVADKIFRFLSARDVRNFARALFVTKNYPNGKYYIN